MTSKTEILRQIQHLQWVILMIHIVIIAIGGGNFGLAVASRPILRLIRQDEYHKVKSICDLMVATGLLQIIIASYDIFSACWKLMKPLYAGIGVACVMIIVDIVAISTCSWLCLEPHMIVAKDARFQPWFLWDCKPHGSCEMGMMYYAERFIIPQIALAVIASVLQLLGIVYLIKLIRILQEKRDHIIQAKEMIRRAQNSRTALLQVPEDAPKVETKQSEWSSWSSDEDIAAGGGEEEDAAFQTPASGSKKMEGATYVPASGDSLDTDYDDVSVMRHRSSTKDPQHSLTFSGNVEIHVFNPHGGDEENNYNTTATTKM